MPNVRTVERPAGHAVLVAVFLLVMAGLPGLAYASPPDPSWIKGIYDGADCDDVVVLATSDLSGAAAGTRGVEHAPAALVTMSPLGERPPSSCSVCAVRPRAPPAP